MDNHRIAQECAPDATVLRDPSAHKLVILDSEGNCLAYLLAWGSFGYDPDTNTHVCRADCDSRELVHLFSKGDLRTVPESGMYVLTAPSTFAVEPADTTIGVAS